MQSKKTSERNQENTILHGRVRLWRSVSWVLALVLIGLVSWFLITGITPGRINQLLQNPSEVSNLVERISNDREFEQTKREIDRIIEQNFVGDKPTTEEYRASILKGYVNALQDRYSEFLTEADYNDITNSLNASFSGIGISFEYFGSYIEVQQVFPDTPALRSGLQVGDRITDVGSESISALGSSDVVRSKITGPEDTQVTLSYIRGSESRTVTITRKKISFPLVTLEKQGDIAIVRVTSFGSSLDTEMARFAAEIRSDSSIKRIVLDLTNNGGGYLDGAVDLVSYFVDPDSTVVIDKKKNGEETLRSRSKQNSLKEYPLVVTGNRFTASASEITIGALQDLRKTPFVGSKTFGKGVVQQIFPLQSGDALKVTIAEWFTPNKRAINSVGLNPDFYVEKEEVKAVLERFSWEENKLK